MSAQIRVGIKDGSLEKRKFIFTINTENAGSASDTFTLPCGNLGTYNATIEWGDGTTSTITSYNDPDLTHIYSTPGIYTVKVLGSLPWVFFGGTTIDRQKITLINQWGYNVWSSMRRSFSGCINLDVVATDVPNVSNVVLMDQIFRGCSSLTQVPNFNQWDTSNVSTLAYSFENCTNITDFDVTGMDVSNVTNLGYTFAKFGALNLFGLDTWNISSLTQAWYFMFGTVIPTTEYDKVLVSWSNLDPINNVNMNFGASKYTLGSDAETARASLISNDLWTITDGGGI